MSTPTPDGGAPKAGRTRGSRASMAQVGVPLLLVCVVITMIVPLPKALLDVLLATNISLAVVILLTSMVVQRALDFSVFPALLLVTTLVRLSLNVSSTRLILLHGDAGHVIQAFGKFVVGGNLVVGLVIFLILIVIQLTVITAGAGRVAEVTARFTLDAMPGKQMAIDADLNAGLITDTEAKKRRADVGNEADFYGAMDGASKFVKGDAMAGVVIVMINLLGGFVIGVVMNHEPISEALSKYALLSVGDGLVSQLPALLISVASGIVVTRVRNDDDGGLGGDLAAQLTGSHRALSIAAVGVGILGMLPGLPKLPFLGLAGLLGFLAFRRRQSDAAATAAAMALAATPPPVVNEGDDLMSNLRVEPLELELAPDLLDLLDPGRGGGLMERVRALRRRIATDLGLVVPPIRTRDQVTLPPETYAIKVHGVEVARGEAPAGHAMVLGDNEWGAGIPGRATIDPVFGLPATWTVNEIADVLAMEGATVIDRASVIVTHLSEVIRRNARDLLSRQDVAALVESVKESAPALAEEIGGDGGLSLAEVQRVLRDLLDEGVPIRDLTRILEAVTSRSRETRVPEALVESARAVLGPGICAAAAVGGSLKALTFEPLLEQSLLEAARSGDNGSWLAVDPVRMEALIEGIGSAMAAAENAGHRPVLVCAAQLRTCVRRLLAAARPDVKVLSYSELSRSVSIEPVGVIRLAERALV
jgi:flagellar biosynthesis protein FlhA